MRLEHAGLRTWWLAVFAGWALLVCLMAAAGLGSRLPAGAGADAARPLPSIPAPGARRVGELSQYAAIAQRPVFSEDRQPHPFVMGGGQGERSGELRLTGVLITPQLRMATFTTDQGRSLRLRVQGDPVEGWRLLSLAPRSATIEGAGGTRTLELQVFDGQGGEPPTPLRTQGPPPAGSTVDIAPPVVGAPTRVATPVPAAPPAAPANAAPGASAAPAPPAPSEAQLQAIRERIEARRRALQQQNAQKNGGPATPSPTQNE